MNEEVILSEREKLAQTRAKLEKKQKLIQEKERKIKLKKTFEFGDLVVKAGLDHLSNEILFGALLDIKEASGDEKVIKRWGEKQEEWTKFKHPQRLIVKLISISENAKKDLKSRKFKWNSFRGEWYGFGRKEELEEVLGASNATIEVAD